LGGYGDAFLAKLDPNGSALWYSTYLGGSGGDGMQDSGVAVDASGAAYVTGRTRSEDFPVSSGAFQTTYAGYEDAFVAKIDTIPNLPDKLYLPLILNGS
jgi:hypothetical protein